MVADTPFFRCFVCGHRISAEWEDTKGCFLHSWKVTVCHCCLTGHRKGLAVRHPAIKQLKRLGLTFQPSAERTVPWPREVPLALLEPPAPASPPAQ